MQRWDRIVWKGLKRPSSTPVQDEMKIELNWKRPLFYLVLPVLVFLAFVGFPPPFAPPAAIRPSQEQSAPAEVDEEES
jgi:hypothetical protein